MALWDDVKKNLTDWYGVAADKTGELAKVGVRRYDIFGLSRDIERQFSEIGSLVYGAVNEDRKDILEDPLLLSLVDKVRDLEGELQAKEQEISEIRTEAEARQAAKTATAAVAAAAGTVEDVVAEPVEDVADDVTAGPVASDPLDEQDEIKTGE
ncbi:hypothetical protein H8E07_20600 [bacterium]|nr:hypothetical protein [bacterium]